MNRSEKLSIELYNSVFGDPWHGASLEKVLENIPLEKIFHKPNSHAHNIMELTLHIDAWIEEVQSRFEGNIPAEPSTGDWPTPQFQSEEYWLAVKQKLFSDTNKLIAIIKKFPENQLNKLVGAERNVSIGPGFSFEGLVIGLVQHNAYHSGQIALLKKSLLQ